MCDALNFISFHEWTLRTTKLNVDFHVIKYSDKSVYVWVGETSPTQQCMDTLACCMQTHVQRDPIAIDILQASQTDADGLFTNMSRDLSVKLTKKLNKQVLVSFNVKHDLLEPIELNDTQEISLLQVIEKSLFDEIKSKPDKF